MPISITIRNVPDETRNELAARAARSGRSLQEYLRAELIELAQREDMETLMARISERVRKAGTQFSAEEILRYRDEGRH
jgi:plasmid stability protein